MLGWSLGGGHGNPPQYSCLENPHGQRSLAGYSPWGHKESDMTEQLSKAAQWVMGESDACHLQTWFLKSLSVWYYLSMSPGQRQKGYLIQYGVLHYTSLPRSYCVCVCVCVCVCLHVGKGSGLFVGLLGFSFSVLSLNILYWFNRVYIEGVCSSALLWTRMPILFCLSTF